jgi:hypothetical protein
VQWHCSPEKTIAIRHSLPFYQSLIASRHLPFTIRYLLLAVVFGSAGASHSHDVAD